MALKKYVVIVAGGKGLRMGTDLPKQFLLLHGKPVLMHTIEAFHRFDSTISIIVVLPKEQVEYWRELCERQGFFVQHIVVHGGSERFYSVKNGLSSISEDEALVAIHDGVRPMVSAETISRCFREAETYGSAIPCITVFDSVRIVDDEMNKPFDRNVLRMVQTPQTFRYSLLKEAYDIVFTPDITDDASVLEKCGCSVHLTEGNRENIKITSPVDLSIAEHLKRNVPNE